MLKWFLVITKVSAFVFEPQANLTSLQTFRRQTTLLAGRLKGRIEIER